MDANKPSTTIENSLEEIVRRREPPKPDRHGMTLTYSGGVLGRLDRGFKGSLQGLLECANSQLLSIDSRRGVFSALEQLHVECERRGIADVFRSVVTKKRLAELRKELKP